uniref:Uncharacterized protein n=1 Tax=Cyanidium sp. THAL103 TaxID=3027999 RepID=A0A9Y1I427_9RHOD|nr:hypothetical protein CspTHAL103_072 [Cyanidium sp. THAL103]
MIDVRHSFEYHNLSLGSINFNRSSELIAEIMPVQFKGDPISRFKELIMKKQGVKVYLPYILDNSKVKDDKFVKKSIHGKPLVDFPLVSLFNLYKSRVNFNYTFRSIIKVNFNYFPVYLIVNSNNKIIMASARNLIYREKNHTFFGSILDFYYKYFVKDIYNLSNVLAPVFFDLNDARMLLSNFLKNSLPQDEASKIVIISLRDAYQLYKNSMHTNIKFRFVPSIREVVYLFNICMHGNNKLHLLKATSNTFLFDTNQNVLNGIPIYVFSKNCLKLIHFDSINFHKIKDLLSTDLIFFSYEDALKFKQFIFYNFNEVDKKLSSNMEISVSNFECLLNLIDDSLENFLCIPDVSVFS